MAAQIALATWLLLLVRAADGLLIIPSRTLVLVFCNEMSKCDKAAGPMSRFQIQFRINISNVVFCLNLEDDTHKTGDSGS